MTVLFRPHFVAPYKSSLNRVNVGVFPLKDQQKNDVFSLGMILFEMLGMKVHRLPANNGICSGINIPELDDLLQELKNGPDIKGNDKIWPLYFLFFSDRVDEHISSTMAYTIPNSSDWHRGFLRTKIDWGRLEKPYYDQTSKKERDNWVKSSFDIYRSMGMVEPEGDLDFPSLTTVANAISKTQ